MKSVYISRLSRRDFIKANLAGMAGFSLMGNSSLFGTESAAKAQVVVLKTRGLRQPIMS